MSIFLPKAYSGGNSGVTTTYDSTHGWIMGGWNTSDYDNREYLLEKTRDGKSFETFPSLPEGLLSSWRWSKPRCLEALDNGGDIFALGSENQSYIFRADSSTWERQPDAPFTRPGKLMQLPKKSQGIFICSAFQQLMFAVLSEPPLTLRLKK